jgi:superfamily II DNA or RNA helicase
MKPLRPYQSDACDAILDEWTRVRSTLLVAATGTGKTRMGCEVIQRRTDAGRTLWLAHRSELLDQAADAIQSNTGLRVGREQAMQRSNVRNLWGVDDHVVVGSIQTMHSDRLDRFFRPDDFATVIVDEAHHAAAKSYRDVLAYFHGAKVLGVTATPDRGDKLGLKAVFETVAYQYEIIQAIGDGYLCGIQSREIVLAGCDFSKVKTTAGDLNQGDLAAMMEDEKLYHAISGALVREAGERPTVVFVPSVVMAHGLASVLRGYTIAPIRAVDGGTARIERAEALDEFAAGRVQFLINCALLTEGWDAPSTSCVAIARPTKSRALYAQMIGRGTRLFPGKSDLLVLDFVPEQAGRHQLISPLDILGGKDLDDDLRREAKEFAQTGMPSLDALAAAEEARAKRQREARLRDEMRQKKIRADVEYRIRAVDPFGVLDQHDMGALASGPRVSTRTLAQLRAAKLDPPDDITESGARKLLDAAIQRQRKGYPTPKVTKILRRWGLDTEIHWKTAGEIISAVLANGPHEWRNPVPPEIRVKYAPKVQP